MVNYHKFSGDKIVLNSSTFGSDNILDINSVTAQKAFEDIANRLQIATDVFDGLFSSEDKAKLDSFSPDVAYRYEETVSVSKTIIDVGQTIGNLSLYMDGILLQETEYSVLGSVITLVTPAIPGQVIAAIFSNRLLTSTDKLKLDIINVDVFNRFESIMEIAGSEINVLEPLTEFSLYIEGILIDSSEYTFTGSVITMNNQIPAGSSVTVFYNNKILTYSDKDKIDSLDISSAVKGDIMVFNGTAWTKLPVGSNGQVLTVDSSTATGLKWQ